MTVDIEKLEALAKAFPELDFDNNTEPFFNGPSGESLGGGSTGFYCVYGQPFEIDGDQYDGNEYVSVCTKEFAEFMCSAKPSVLELIADQKRMASRLLCCTECGGQGEVYSGHTSYEGYNQPPEPIMERCGECDGDGALGNATECISILDEIEALRAENAGLKTGYEAYERVNAELTQRLANLELCQTASLGVSGIIKSAASELGFDAACEDSALDYLVGLARSAAAFRAECRISREDAQRYRWLRDKSESVHQFYLSTPIWFTGVKFSKENVDSTIDAAMSEVASHD